MEQSRRTGLQLDCGCDGWIVTYLGFLDFMERALSWRSMAAGDAVNRRKVRDEDVRVAEIREAGIIVAVFAHYGCLIWRMELWNVQWGE